MREILLTQGKVALVDDWNYNWLNQYRWYAHKNSYGGYNVDRITRLSNGKQYTQSMARLIMRLEYGNKLLVDHKSHQTLDNRECNLRVCNHTQNAYNRKMQKRQKSSKFKGVRFNKLTNNWRANIKIGGADKHLGLFKNEREAALQYDLYARRYYGEFALTNL